MTTERNEKSPYTDESDPGTGPATSASPSSSAHESGAVDEPRRPFHPEITDDADEGSSGNGVSGPLSDEDDSEAVAAIYKIFRQKLSGLRRLPRGQRQAAFRAARNWLAIAMGDVREKRSYRRHALYMLRKQRRLQNPSPGGQ
jgi:hypothetical protein